MSNGWKVEKDDVETLTAQVKARLLADYGYTPDATHTHVALVCIRNTSVGDRVIDAFPYSLRAADWTGRTGDLEAAIDAACRARLLVLRNAAPLASIVDRWHPL